ncbi:MAG: hypothetical protein EBQ92_00500, partial [Proteobacteria bacterium]|nr:hypothetical protein [Pseudomonadota bacterium]
MYNGVVAYYKFDNNLYDSSCNGYNLTTLPYYENAVYDASGKYGQAVKFNGLTYQAIYPSTFPNCPKITVIAWVKIPNGYTSSLPYNSVYRTSISGSGVVYDFGMDSSGYIYANVFNKTYTNQLNKNPLNDGKWHPVVWQADVTDPTNIKLSFSIDGVTTNDLVGNISPNKLTETNNSNLAVGAGQFSGIIDNLMVWDRILSGNEISSVLNQPYLIEVCTTQTPTPTISLSPSLTNSPTTTPSKPSERLTPPAFTLLNATQASASSADGSFEVLVTNFGQKGTTNGSSVNVFVSDDNTALNNYVLFNTLPSGY